jgi:hypothetical protein
MSDETAGQSASNDDQPAGKEAKQAKSKPAKQAKQAKAKPAKDKKGGKADKQKPKGKKARAAGKDSDLPSVAAHPRAGGQVRRAKGWGGLIGFAIAAYLSMHAGVPMLDIGLRALTAGACGYLLAWACSVTVWRHLVLAELRLAEEHGKPEPPDRPRGAEPAGVPRRDRP